MNETATLLHHKEFILWIFFRNPVQVTGAAVPRALLQQLQECPSGTAPWVRERTWKCFELNMSGSATWYLLTERSLIASDPPCSGKPSCTATPNWFVYYFKLLSSEGSWRNCTDVAVTTSTQEARSQEFCKCSQVLDFDLYFLQQRREYSVFLGENTSWGGQRTPAACPWGFRGALRARQPPSAQRQQRTGSFAGSPAFHHSWTRPRQPVTSPARCQKWHWETAGGAVTEWPETGEARQPCLCLACETTPRF